MGIVFFSNHLHSYYENSYFLVESYIHSFIAFFIEKYALNYESQYLIEIQI